MLQFRTMSNESTEEKQPVSAEEFITRWPLYTPAPVDGFNPPGRISFTCNGAPCGKETTWFKLAKTPKSADVEGLDAPFFQWICYVCGLCGDKYLFVMYRELENEERTFPRLATSATISAVRSSLPPAKHTVTTKIQKIGQSPALSIEIQKPLEKNLGEEHAALYKKALINRNEGYGLGAVSYMRRVVEDKTEDLIEVVAQLAEAHHIDADTIKKLRAAKNEKTTYDQKLKIAATVLPKSLVIDGVNPLDVLYGLVSAGLHDLTEEQCIAIADDIRSVFEYTFSRLRAEAQEKQEFGVEIKRLSDKLAGMKAPKASADEPTKKPTA
jgi:hypothetical protein